MLIKAIVFIKLKDLNPKSIDEMPQRDENAITEHDSVWKDPP